MTRRQPSRLPQFGYLGFLRYFLTARTGGRRPLFADAEVVSVVATQFLRTARDEECAVLAYCFRPDHLHLLVEGRGPGSDLRRFMTLGRQRATHHTRRLVSGALWQDGYYARVVRRDEETAPLIRDGLHDPVRPGLAERAEDYPCAWCRWG